MYPDIHKTKRKEKELIFDSLMILGSHVSQAFVLLKNV